MNKRPTIYVSPDHVCDPKIISSPWRPEPTEDNFYPYVSGEEVDKFCTAARAIIKNSEPGGSVEMLKAAIDRLQGHVRSGK